MYVKNLHKILRIIKQKVSASVFYSTASDQEKSFALEHTFIERIDCGIAAHVK